MLVCPYRKKRFFTTKFLFLPGKSRPDSGVALLRRLVLMKQRTYERLPNLGGPNKGGESVFWDIRETGHAGKGLFAVRAVQTRDAVASESPLELYTICV